ncbi:MAG: GntR family transcriptional regulator [Anaerolineales bacterium]|jgi:GntR family transcriptional regulator
MEIRIDLNSTEPIYLQIISAIKHQVANGRLKPGEQLPTVRMLATDLRINPNTVARAYETLDTEGVISTQRGRGTFVREHPDDVYLTQVRKDQLKAMMDNVINNALCLGYPAEEIRLAFEIELAHWERERRSTASAHDKRLAEPDAKLAVQKT